MAAEERAAVKTYVPTYQKEEWERHADQLDMSQSEFVRTMVQAGRSDIEIPSAQADHEPPANSSEPPAVDDGNLQSTIRRELAADEATDWETLVERIVGNLEGDIEAALEELQQANQVFYSGRKGGYLLNGHE